MQSTFRDVFLPVPSKELCWQTLLKYAFTMECFSLSVVIDSVSGCNSLDCDLQSLRSGPAEVQGLH